MALGISTPLRPFFHFSLKVVEVFFHKIFEFNYNTLGVCNDFPLLKQKEKPLNRAFLFLYKFV